MFHVEFLTPIGNTASQFIHPLSESPSTASAKLLLMVQKSGDHQLRLVVYPMIYKVLYTSKQCLALKFLNHQRRILVHFKVKLASFRQKARTSGAPMGFIFPPKKNQSMLCPPKPEDINFWNKSMVETFIQWFITSWWLNQPTWKICSSNWIISNL